MRVHVLALVSLLTAACGAASSVKSSSDNLAGGQTRQYYIAADEVVWDYIPGARDEITGQPFQPTGYFKNGPKPVSTKYKKVLYREYTDGTFKTLKPRAPEWEHLGFLGPVLHAKVGDTIRIVFRNNGHQPFSMHPHGVFYNKDSEGAPYNDGTSGNDKHDDGVPPGDTHTYVWAVPERAGPGPHDGSSVMWMYHSHANEVKDVNSGLMGAMIVTARGQAKEDGSPKDVDRELMMFFAQVHEEDSWLAGENLGPVAFNKDNPVQPPPPGLSQNFYPYFVTFSVNGFSHGSLPLSSVTVKKGERVRWYVFASTNDFDAHAPHWHGNTVLINQMRMDVTSLLPMEMITANMTPDNVGTWLFHCHVSFHMTEGMQARFAVAPAANLASR